jgi:hypothetical protein
MIVVQENIVLRLTRVRLALIATLANTKLTQWQRRVTIAQPANSKRMLGRQAIRTVLVLIILARKQELVPKTTAWPMLDTLEPG